MAIPPVPLLQYIMLTHLAESVSRQLDNAFAFGRVPEFNEPKAMNSCNQGLPHLFTSFNTGMMRHHCDIEGGGTFLG